jgi:hypothetical protein
VGLDFLIVEVPPSHSDTPHSVGLLWTNDQLLAETTHNTHNRQISMSPAGFKTAIPARQRPQTHAIDSAGTGIA